MPVLLLHRRGPIAVARAYFGIPQRTPKCDILHVRHVAEPICARGWINTSVQNLHGELSECAGKRWSLMQKGTRYDIKRATNDGVEAELLVSPGDGEIEHFVARYNEFAAQKELPLTNVELLTTLRRNN